MSSYYITGKHFFETSDGGQSYPTSPCYVPILGTRRNQNRQYSPKYLRQEQKMCSQLSLTAVSGLQKRVLSSVPIRVVTSSNAMNFLIWKQYPFQGSFQRNRRIDSRTGSCKLGTNISTNYDSRKAYVIRLCAERPAVLCESCSGYADEI